MPPFSPSSRSSPPRATDPRTGGQAAFNAPPPSPQLAGAGPTGQFPPEMAGLAPAAQIGTDQLPPEIQAGIMQTGEDISAKLDALAQVTPDLAGEWQAIKTLLVQTLAKVLVAGAPPASPTAPGAAFPGGGIGQPMLG